MSGRIQRAGFLEQGLIDNMYRGRDSTGLALIKNGEEKKQAIVYKRALTAFDFVLQPYYKKIADNIDEFSIVMGHTRSATGSTKVTDRNAHPFQHGHITLVHNGHIRNQYSVLPHAQRPVNSGIEVDSDAVAYLMSQAKDEITVLEQLEGPFVFVWHNAKTGKLHMARSKDGDRPMSFMYIKKENTMVWASEYTGLYHWLDRRNMDCEDVGWELAENYIVTFDLKDLRRWSQRPFVQKLPLSTPFHGAHTGTESDTTSVIGPSQSTHLTSNKGISTGQTSCDGTSQDRWIPPSKEEQDKISQAIRTMEGDNGADPDDDKALKEYLHQLKTVYKHSSGCPHTVKAAKKAARALGEFQYRLGQLCLFTPIAFALHQNPTKNQLGIMEGRIAGMIPAVMHSVPKARWDKYREFGKVYALCVNVRRLESKKKAIVIVEHPRHQKFEDDFFRGTHTGDREKRLYLGPRSIFITEREWNEYTKDGCLVCGDPLTVFDHAAIFWADGIASEHGPVCVSCQKKTETWCMLYQDDYDFKPKTKALVPVINTVPGVTN